MVGKTVRLRGNVKKKKSFEVMNTVSRVAPGCNFFSKEWLFVVLLAGFYCTTNFFQSKSKCTNSSLELVF